MQCYPLRFQLFCEMSVKYRFIEFIFFDYGSFPYLPYLLGYKTHFILSLNVLGNCPASNVAVLRMGDRVP